MLLGALIWLNGSTDLMGDGALSPVGGWLAPTPLQRASMIWTRRGLSYAADFNPALLVKSLRFSVLPLRFASGPKMAKE